MDETERYLEDAIDYATLQLEEVSRRLGFLRQVREKLYSKDSEK